MARCSERWGCPGTKEQIPCATSLACRPSRQPRCRSVAASAGYVAVTGEQTKGPRAAGPLW